MNKTGTTATTTTTAGPSIFGASTALTTGAPFPTKDDGSNTSKVAEFKPSITFGAASTTTTTAAAAAAVQPTFGSFATSFKPITTTTETSTLSSATKDDHKTSDVNKPYISSGGFTTLTSGTSPASIIATPTASTTTISKQDDEKEKHQEKYYIELRGLNASFVEHIQSIVNTSPFADLSDSWDAYQKYYQTIDASLKLIQ
jgi:hypothetical protein